MEQQGMNTTEKRILAIFQPQAWERDYAVDIDGRCEVDVTDKVLSLALDEIIGLDDDDYDTDDLVDLRVLGHNGPFYVTVKEQVAEFFGVDRLADVTQEMLDAARTLAVKPVSDGDKRAAKALNAICDAVDIHAQRLGIEGDHEIKVWHLLASLHEYCGIYAVDLPQQFADVRRQIDAGEIASPEWIKWNGPQPQLQISPAA